MRTLILVAALVPACTVPNPAFDVDATAGATTTTEVGTSTRPTTDATSATSGTSEASTVDRSGAWSVPE